MHALGMRDHRWRPAPPPRTPGAQQPAAHHKLGFADSERIPVILEPQKLYDAFQDIARTGPLPYNLSKGSLPVYFPMNHKFIGEYMHKVFYPPEKKQAWELTASRQGPFGGAHEAQHGRALVLDTSQPANSPALEDRRGGQDYLGTFMTERRHFDGTVTRLSSPAHTVTRLSSPAHTVTRVQPGSHGDAFVSPGSEHTTGFDTAGRPWQSQGAQILRIHTSDVSQDGRPATAASALGTERARGKTHNAHAFDPMPIGSHDKVLREMRTEHWPRPELRVWAQQEIREAREALDAECARERDWGSRQVQVRTRRPAVSLAGGYPCTVEGDRGALPCHWNAIATPQQLGPFPFLPRGLLQLEGQSRTRGDQRRNAGDKIESRQLWCSRCV